MQGVIERRRHYLGLMRHCTLDHGHFTVTDIQQNAKVPRSTAQDWINRLIAEGCVAVKEPKKGRTPARYAATSAMPQSACRRIFTTVDGDWVEIFHECMSGGCAAFCGHHHTIAGGVIAVARRDGTLLRECARIGGSEVRIGLYPSAAVGISGIRRSGKFIVQHVRCIGGPAYSLTDMISHADGVENVRIRRKGAVVEGEVWTRALNHLVIGVDDTDTPAGGATFALALALLQHLATLPDVFPIGHHVAMLYPGAPVKTAGNSCSFIEVAVDPAKTGVLLERVNRFVADEALSPEWGVATREGFLIPAGLRDFGLECRRKVIKKDQAERTAQEFGVRLAGGDGIIGALAGVGLCGLDNAVLLDPRIEPGEGLAGG
ncbi:MAG: sugar-specific transcriptional regulator TrmB [Methanoregulaceae archaeon]|nr:sugar-specific transcriptional regulator TrmB [Methanoregulaceae archaeon]